MTAYFFWPLLWKNIHSSDRQQCTATATTTTDVRKKKSEPISTVTVTVTVGHGHRRAAAADTCTGRTRRRSRRRNQGNNNRVVNTTTTTTITTTTTGITGQGTCLSSEGVDQTRRVSQDKDRAFIGRHHNKGTRKEGEEGDVLFIVVPYPTRLGISTVLIYDVSINREKRGRCCGIIIISMVPIGQSIIQRTQHTIMIVRCHLREKRKIQLYYYHFYCSNRTIHYPSHHTQQHTCVSSIIDQHSNSLLSFCRTY